MENSVFCKTMENASVQLLTPDEREVLHPENICEPKQTTHLPSVNRPVNSSKCAFSAVHRNGKLPDNGTNTVIHQQQNRWKILDFQICEHL